MLLSRFFWWAFPLFILFIAYGLVVWPLLSAESAILLSLPYILAAVLLVFAGIFNRSRFVIPVFSTLFVYWAIRQRLQTPLADASTMNFFVGLNLVMCFQLVFAAVTPEKGLFNRWGAVVLVIAAIPAFWLWMGGWPVWLAEQIAGQIDVNAMLRKPLSQQRYWLTEFLFYVHIISGLLLLALAACRRTATEYALILTWLVGALVFYDFAQPNVSAIGYSGLMMALLVIFLQSNYQITFIDTLTGIPGRRAMEDYLPTLGRRYAIAMLDVDHFKKFNDTYGHDVGDQVLKMVAGRINQVAGGGRAFRFGGEEFTVIFNRCDARGCFDYLDAVRQAVQNHQMTLRRKDRDVNRKKGRQQRGQKSNKRESISVTLSIGIADSAQGLTTADVIKRADGNLYRAKKAGRNQTWRPEA